MVCPSRERFRGCLGALYSRPRCLDLQVLAQSAPCGLESRCCHSRARPSYISAPRGVWRADCNLRWVYPTALLASVRSASRPAPASVPFSWGRLGPGEIQADRVNGRRPNTKTRSVERGCARFHAIVGRVFSRHRRPPGYHAPLSQLEGVCLVCHPSARRAARISVPALLMSGGSGGGCVWWTLDQHPWPSARARRVAHAHLPVAVGSPELRWLGARGHARPDRRALSGPHGGGWSAYKGADSTGIPTALGAHRHHIHRAASVVRCSRCGCVPLCVFFTNAVGSNVLVFGGIDIDGGFSNQAIALDLQARETRLLSDSSPHTVVPRVRSGLALSSCGTEVFLFGGCDEQSGALGDLHTLQLATTTAPTPSCCKLRWSAVACEMNLEAADKVSTRLHGQEFPSHAAWRRSCRQAPWRWYVICTAAVALAVTRVYFELFSNSDNGILVAQLVGLLLGWLMFFLTPLHHGQFPLLINDAHATIAVACSALRLYLNIRLHHCLFVALNSLLVISLLPYLAGSSGGDSFSISWQLRASFLVGYALIVPVACLCHEFWLRRFCQDYYDAARRCAISVLLYITIGLPVVIALPLGVSVGALASREYFLGVRQFQQRHRLELTNTSGFGSMGSVGCHGGLSPVAIDYSSWTPRWRRCGTEPFEQDGSACGYYCWRFRAAWARTNRILVCYTHTQTDFRLAGKPSELSAVDSGVYRATVMQLAHVCGLLVVSFGYDLYLNA
eukprot:TRINITY_DN9386_c0_g1_i3.p1 TRINITY_DN9386_c0_g1~~TRINITY_DN9386_c0_g1_i3.p1  ORF type:complete len:732 (+),score=27.57 TRINITY_DN9386_c0_g1_i3:313-2508(+)